MSSNVRTGRTKFGPTKVGTSKYGRKEITGSNMFRLPGYFYLPGDKLSSTDTARQVINVEPGTEPINTRNSEVRSRQASEEIGTGRDNRRKHFPME